MKKYTATAIVVHWAMAAGIVGIFLFGRYMAEDLAGVAGQAQVLLVAQVGRGDALLAFRIVWRATHRPPELLVHMSRGERFVAHAGHAASTC